MCIRDSTSTGELVSTNGTLRRDVSDSSFTVSGDTASNTGANINLYGASHGSLANVFRVRVGASEKLRITSAGYVGINETNPGTHLHVEQDNAHSSTYYLNSDAAILVDNKNASGKAVIKLEHDAAFVYGSGSSTLIFSDRQNERLRINSDGRVLIGHTSARVISTTVNAYLQLEGTTFHQSAISVTRNTNDAYGSYFILGKSRGTSVGSNSTLQDGDTIGEIRFAGSDGSDMVSMTALIKSVVDGTPGTDDMPGALTFNTTADGAATTTERLRIKSDGNMVHSSSEAFQVAKGTTGQRPSSAVVGMVRFNTTTDQLENYNSNTGWQNVNVKTPIINSISGNIYAGMATNLDFTLTDNSSTITITFKEGSTTHATLTNQSVSSGTITVAVPSAVYGQSVGDTITITVTNSDGVISAGSNKTVQTAPSGGTITTSGNYRIHSFTSSGTFVNTVASLGVEYLIIAGGGAGGSAGSSVAGGGGGAGGYRSNVSGQSSGGGNSAESSMSLSATSYTVTVGGGASATPGTGDQGGARGSNSTFNSITSTGGGGGGGNGVDSGESSGGSGGGGKESNGSGGSGTSGQGYDGGDGSESNNAGGGGGGAGEEGNTDGFPHGGDGVSSNITGSSVTRGGGGSSGNTSGGYGAVGGTGGGGTASMAHNSPAQNGTANTGGGGGGAYGISVGASGAGGSGIVIIRYNLTTI